MQPFTTETFFNGQLTVVQPKHGYRYTTDPVVLASHVLPRPAETVLDIGTGSGILPLILGFRNRGIRIVGVEIQQELARAARHNVKINAMADQVDIICRDIRTCDQSVFNTRFNRIISNPPYRSKNTGRISPSLPRAIARHELMLTLDELVQAAERLLIPEGELTVIFPSDRFEELVAGLDHRGLAVEWARFIHTKKDRAASRVIVSARKGGCRVPLKILEHLCLMDDLGNPTQGYAAMFTP